MSSYEYQLELEASWENKYKSFRKIESEHFIFYVPKEDKVDITTQEWFYRYITTLFGVEPEEKIIYLKCGASINEITGSSYLIVARAYLDKNIIISTNEWESHELIHIIQYLISGYDPIFFSEGLAVAYEMIIPREKFINIHRDAIHEYVQEMLIKDNSYISITKILTSKKFEAVNNDIIMGLLLGAHYYEAGSFVRYLIDVYGLEKFFQFLKLSNYWDSKSEIKKKFLIVYNFSIQEVEKQWLEFLKENY